MADPVRYGHGVTLYPPNPDTKRPRWRVVWYSFDGSRKQRHLTHKQDAQQAAEQVVQQLAAGPTDRPEGATHRPVADLARWYLHPDSHDRPWSEHHLHTQQSVVRRWVLPHIGETPCRDLTRQHMVGILNAARQQVGTHQVRKIGACLRRMVNVGHQAGYFADGHDPMHGVKYTPRSYRHGQTSVYIEPHRRPDTGSVEKLAVQMAADGPWWRALQVRMAAYCGLRWGELAALEASDVDLEEGIVRADRQVTYVGAARVGKLPKYDKVRETFVPSFLAEPLAARMAEQLPEPDRSCFADHPEVRLGSGGLLFPAPAGGYDRTQPFHQRRFRPACQRAGWPRTADGGWQWSWHDLRHHFCTWALASPPSGLGLEVADVAYFAGHASPSFTWAAYVATRPGAVDRARDASRRYAD